MDSSILYYVVLAAVLFWVRADGRASTRSLFMYWWTGILLSRVAPITIEQITGESAGLAEETIRALLVTLSAIGNVFVIRAVLGLASSGRTWRRQTRVSFALLLLALLFVPTGEGSGTLITLALASFYLGAVPWRDRVGPGFLALAAFTGLVSFLLMIVTFDVETASGPLPSSALTQSLLVAARPLAAIYGLVTAFRSGGRIHLSIRRVSRRLVTSHLMSGIVPVVLVTLFLLLSGSLFLSMYRGQVGSRYLAMASEQARQRMSASLAVSGQIAPDVFAVESGRQTILVLEEGSRVAVIGAPPSFPPEALLAREEPSNDVPLIWDRQQLYVRARLDTLREGRPIRYEVLAPLDSLDLARVSRVLGMPVQIAPRMLVRSSGGGVQISSEDEEMEERRAARRDGSAERTPGAPRTVALSADSLGDGIDSLLGKIDRSSGEIDGLSGKMSTSMGEIDSLADGNDVPRGEIDSAIVKIDRGASAPNTIGPGATGNWRIPGGALVRCLRWEDGEFTSGQVPLLSNAFLAEPVSSLISVARENPLATVGLIALAFIAVLLLGVIWATTSMVATMIRSVTGAVRALKEATKAIGEGRLDHRIALAARDDLWSVAASFNEMAAGLERMRRVERENQRLEQELQLAREIQHRLLPASAPSYPEFDIAGVSISAREVGGDYFDYIPLEGGSVVIAVADVSGKGAAAALLMSSFRASLRSHDLASLGPAQTMTRLNRFVHGSVAPGKFITAFLGILDPKTGELEYSCAGHEPPLVIGLDGTTVELSTGGMVLGLFANAEYEEARAQLPQGAMLAIFTDGVTEAQSPEGLFYGETHLVDTLQSMRGVSCPQVLERVVNALKDFSGNAVQFDDVTMVLARRL